MQPRRNQFFHNPCQPSLRRLEILGNDHCDEDEDEHNWRPAENTILWTLPSVTSLIAHNVRSIPLRLHYLTSFKFRDGDGETMIDPLLEFLDNCPLLEDIDISYESGSSCSRNHLVSLPNIRAYTQQMYDSLYDLRLFNMLSLPPVR